jgi:hypothetical protein
MIIKILTGWFLINTHSFDDNRHNYNLYDQQNNTFIAATVDHEFPKQNISCNNADMCFVKLKMTAECVKSYSWPVANSKMPLITTLCNANKVQELKCTERNSFVINGIRYC